MDDLFYTDDYNEEEKTDDSSSEGVDKLKKIKSDEVLADLYARANRKRKIKTSVFSKVDKELLKTLSEYIVTKKMSYRVALEKIQSLYPEDPSFKNKRHESLRYFLIKHNFINNEKALATINKSISKSQYARNKRDRIISDVIEEIFENHIDKIIENPLFISKIQMIIEEKLLEREK